MRSVVRGGVGATLLLALAAAASAAELSVGTGASFDLGTGHLGLGCADLTVAGTLSAGSVGFSAARDVAIEPSGIVNGNSATLEVAGEWDNAGTFNAGTSTLRLVDGCGLLSAVIAGESTFATLELVSATGKLFRFAAGSTQTVAGSLLLQGAAGSLLTLRSTLDGNEAFLDLQGSYAASYVDVEDNHSIGSTIVLPPGSVVGTNAPGWSLAALVPSLGLAGRALLALGLLWIVRRGLATRRPAPG